MGTGLRQLRQKVPIKREDTLDKRWLIANEVHSTKLAITRLVSNKHKCNEN